MELHSLPWVDDGSKQTINDNNMSEGALPGSMGTGRAMGKFAFQRYEVTLTDSDNDCRNATYNALQMNIAIHG